MPKFRYRAYTALGDLQEGEIEAGTRDEAESALFKQGLTPFETQQARSTSPNSFLGLSRKRGPSATELASFTREFATLEQADIPLDQSLRLLAVQSASRALRELAENILARIVDGASLSETLAGRPDVFGTEYINVIREGEAVGKLGPALNELAEMLERRTELRARIKSALIYPSLLITLAVVSTAVVLGTLVPNVAPIFADNGRPMPAGLQFIIDVEAQWPALVSFVVIGVGAVILVLRLSQSRPAWRQVIDRSFLRLPFIGALLSQYAMGRFSHTLGSMLNAGVPLLQALESARAGVANAYLNSKLLEVIASVRGGSHLSAALARIEHIPSVAPQMISIGEETGRLDEMALRIATMFEQKTHRSIEQAMGLVTPVLTILIAGAVGGLIMTVMDAVLGINELAMK